MSAEAGSRVSGPASGPVSDAERGAPVIELSGVCAAYRSGELILRDVDLPIYAGDYLAILGPNGGGKTTLLKVVLGLIAPTRGEVVYRLESGGGRRGRRPRIGYVPQFSTFEAGFPLTVEEVVLMGRLAVRKIGRRYRREDRQAARQWLERVQLDGQATELVGELSGGQVQRLLLARALAGDPQALLLDEPMASLDAESRQVVRRLLIEVRQRMPVVLVTHDPTNVAQDIQHIACLNRRLTYHGGAEVPEGALEETYGCPVELISHGLPHRVLAAHDQAGTDHAGTDHAGTDHAGSDRGGGDG